MSDKHKSILQKGLALSKGARWHWSKAQANAFEVQCVLYVAKNVLQKDTLLVYYDSNRQLVLACEASPYGFGAVLSHIMDDGQE